MASITGTFIDEITVDIGSQNWSEQDWERDFDAMAFIGIDTVIIIRGGLRHQAVFPSEVVGNPKDPDLAQVFLDQAAKHKMRLFFGAYDTGTLYAGGGIDVDEELSMNTRFVDEVMSRYGGHPALGGWYITHEVCGNERGINSLYTGLASYLKKITPSLPILISPFYPSKFLLRDQALSPDQFLESWRELLQGLGGLIDIMAFQDGTCDVAELPDYLPAVKALSEECGIESWNNVETFDRQKSYNFPPRDIRALRERLEIADPYVTKQITFEFSHFMSPNSCFPGAANLYRRYCEVMLGRKSPF